MAVREFDPFRLDVEAFAKEAGHLQGRWPLASFDRLQDSAVRIDDAALGGEPAHAEREVRWSVRGEARSLRGGDVQIWLHVAAQTALPLECQRCLQPVETAIEAERSFLFVRGEDLAADLDAQSEDDVLAMTRALDLRELIEDELLLALPLIPRHDVCESLLPMAEASAQADGEPPEERPNPFAALAALKRGTRLN